MRETPRPFRARGSRIIFVERMGGLCHYLRRHNLLDARSAVLLAATYNRAYAASHYDRLQIVDHRVEPELLLRERRLEP